jgi:iron only hydrogenase large subunit-like protein
MLHFVVCHSILVFNLANVRGLNFSFWETIEALNKDLLGPGWVCYAEKTHGADILPHISAVKSPQQAMGAIVKRYACSSLGLQPEDVYHVTVMPCYDKKLEASREDFVFSGEVNGETDGPQMTEVDCVLTTTEVLDLLATKSADFIALEEAPLDRLLANVDESEQLFGVQGGSGGYAECIFRYAASVLFGKEVTGPLKFKVLRNSDFQETSLEIGGKPVLQFACVYGFRNIQNLVRRIKSGKCEYHYVEIMACPSGCLNGGGQIKPRKGQSAKDLIQLIEVTYANDIEIRDPFSNKITQGLYDQWLGYPGSAKACEIMQTQYHSREKTVGSYISDW